MQLLTRFILVLAFMLQPLAGLGVGSCAGMGSGGEAEGGASAKPCVRCCCRDSGDGSTAQSPAAPACCCVEMPDKAPIPVAPAPSNSQLSHLLVFLPTLMGFVMPEPVVAHASWPTAARSIHRPSNSVQSLLCVWVM